MKLHRYQPLLAVLALGLLTGVASAAPKTKIKERGKITLDVALQPAAAAPAGATASATIAINKPKLNQRGTATLILTTSGLLTGDYGVDAVLKGGLAPVHIGDFNVPPPAVVDPVPFPPVSLAIPSDVDASLIASLTVSDSSPALIFEGDATVTSVDWQYLANVPVTGDVQAPGSGKGKGPKVKAPFGHLISQSTVKAGVETKRHFLWVAHRAPADTELTINVDGVAVGTVTSTKNGKVMFHEMPEPVVLRDIQLITLTDGSGAIVMKAVF